MGKSSKRKSTQPSLYDDKPAFAMDLFKQPAPKKTVKAESETAIHVKERLNAGALSALEQLRREMESVIAQDGNGKSDPARKPTPPAVTTRARDAGAKTGDADRDVSFAEMFDPQPEDDVDFDALLKDSKQDWREYK
jgi:hypothetical protein